MDDVSSGDTDSGLTKDAAKENGGTGSNGGRGSSKSDEEFDKETADILSLAREQRATLKGILDQVRCKES